MGTETVGRFEIRRELGRGAQSIVYLAWDPQLQREVAIKTLHFSRADTRRNAALLAEARAVSALRHPNLVPIFDAGEEGGDPYLVFEFVDGPNLAELIAREGRLAPARAADLMRQVLDALAVAHAAGIIHRDLKPSNILIDAQGRPRVMDFGIATRLDALETEKNQAGITGTLNYLAPEYLESREVDEKSDVYAAGLVLLEMITGRQQIQGNTPTAIINAALNQPIVLPADLPIDQKLASIILRACARDASQRLESAAQAKSLLDDYLGAAATPIDMGSSEAKKQDTLEFLMRRMRHKADFPALSESVSAINKMTRSDKESINRLSNSILKDYGLTNKILRMVNSVHYRQAGGGSISTVSRAVIVLGFDAIRNIAITVLLFEHLQDKGSARELKEAFLRANLAGTLARDASKQFMAREAEEAYVCALFHSVGQLLAQFYFPEEVSEIRKVMLQKSCSEEIASAQVLGLSFSELGIGIARHWGFPPAIIHSLRPLPEGVIKRPATHEDALRVLAGFANEVCAAIASVPKEQRRNAIQAARERFTSAMPFSDSQLQDVLEKSFDELSELATILHVNLTQSPFVRQVKSWTGHHTDGSPTSIDEDSLEGTRLGDTGLPEQDDFGGVNENGVPDAAQEILAAGIQDISNSLVDDFSLNDVLRITLETMYRAMGFERVLLCLKDPKTGSMAGRFGFGADTNDLARQFRIPLTDVANVFQLAISKGVDIIITDVDDPKIADKIPAWYRKLVIARTFVLFPLIIKGNPVALIYCDRDKPGSIVIPERELSLLKTLRNQAVLAIKQST